MASVETTAKKPAWLCKTCKTVVSPSILDAFVAQRRRQESEIARLRETAARQRDRLDDLHRRLIQAQDELSELRPAAERIDRMPRHIGEVLVEWARKRAGE